MHAMPSPQETLRNSSRDAGNREFKLSGETTLNQADVDSYIRESSQARAIE
jgi:hypothetical protein